MKKVCLITGSSRGIGRATAEFLSRRGYAVYATMREPHGRNAEAAAEVGKFASVLELDVIDSKTITAAVDVIQTEQGRLDAVVNNAGFALWGPVEEVSIEAVQRLFEVNFLGCLRVSQAVLPIMRRRRTGVLVQVSSISGRVVTPLLGMYQASKHALEAMSEAMAYEVGHFGVRVVLIEPGDVKTGIVIEGTPLLKLGRSAYQELNQRIIDGRKHRVVSFCDPREVAAAIAEAIENPSTPLRVVVEEGAEKIDKLRHESTDAEYASWLWKEINVEW